MDVLHVTHPLKQQLRASNDKSFLTLEVQGWNNPEIKAFWRIYRFLQEGFRQQLHKQMAQYPPKKVLVSNLFLAAGRAEIRDMSRTLQASWVVIAGGAITKDYIAIGEAKYS